MITPSAAPCCADGGSTWRAQTGSILLAGLGGFIALALARMPAQKTSQPWIPGSFGATCGRCSAFLPVRPSNRETSQEDTF
jgi:hypothetical protein